ncbi:MAG: hypothetical protein AAF126_08255 [Chloroflexota bacterium]
MRYLLSICVLLMSIGIAYAQEDTSDLTPYEIAQQRIAEAVENDATVLSLFELELTELPPEIGTATTVTTLYLYGSVVN